MPETDSMNGEMSSRSPPGDFLGISRYFRNVGCRTQVVPSGGRGRADGLGGWVGGDRGGYFGVAEVGGGGVEGDLADGDVGELGDAVEAVGEGAGGGHQVAPVGDVEPGGDARGAGAAAGRLVERGDQPGLHDAWHAER